MVRFAPLLVLFGLLSVASAFFFGGRGGSPPPFPSGRPRFPPRGSHPPHPPHFSGSPPPFPTTGTPPQKDSVESDVVEKREACLPDDVKGGSGSPPPFPGGRPRPSGRPHHGRHPPTSSAPSA